MAHIVEELPRVTVIGDIAAALTGDEQFLAGAFGVVFQNGDGHSLLQRGAGGHQPGGAAADDEKIGHRVVSFL